MHAILLSVLTACTPIPKDLSDEIEHMIDRIVASKLEERGIQESQPTPPWYDKKCATGQDRIRGIGSIQDNNAKRPNALDTAWILNCGARVFFVQAGFALLECGMVRQSNAKQILLKNTLDASVGGLLWFFVGYPLAYGYTFTKQRESKDGTECYSEKQQTGNQFFGGAFWALADAFRYCGDPMNNYTSSSYVDALHKVPIGDVVNSTEFGDHCIESPVPTMEHPDIFSHWFMQWGFGSTASTIISGAVAERLRLSSYILVASVVTAFVYPVVVAWTWSHHGWTSFASPAHYYDFAGSGVVHITGGFAALIGAIAAGPRPGRFERPIDYAPSNIALVYLGTLILWFCWYGFNPGSTQQMQDGQSALAASLAVTNTTLSACSGAVSALLLSRMSLHVAFLRQKPINEDEVHIFDQDPYFLCNGLLSGLVSITAGCANVQPWSAIVIGFLSACVYMLSSSVVMYYGIDDPLDAFSIHGANGVLGVLCAATFDLGGNGFFYGRGDGTTLWYNATQHQWEGVSKLEQLSQQALTALAIATWSMACTAPVYFTLKYFGVLVEDQMTLEIGVEEAIAAKQLQMKDKTKMWKS